MSESFTLLNALIIVAYVCCSHLLKDGMDPDDNTEVLQSDVLECNDDETVQNIDNDYGLTDQDFSKCQWQIVVGDTLIKASFLVTFKPRFC